MTWIKYWNHFKTITKHKLYVGLFCIKCGYIWRGITHDLSKYSMVEFGTSARYFQGDKSPIDAEKTATGYSIAWQHHKGHNPHHWEYWIDNVGTYSNTPLPIPHKYIIEMICDWLGAGIVYSNNKVDFNSPYDSPIKYYEKCKNQRIFEEHTQNEIESYLQLIADKGINAFCKKVRSER